MRDRLKVNIKVLKRHNETHIPVLHITDGRKQEIEVIDEICEDASLILRKIEDKTLIELPCKVGNTVYKLFPPYCHKRAEDKCDHYCDGYDTTCEEYDGVYEIYDIPFKLGMLDDFGKTVFLTREEAERALKERA